MNLQDFRLSRAYFFGILIRPGINNDGSLKFYPCMLCNQKGVLCRHPCDPFGHHAFVCKITTKTADHNLARDILATMGLAFGFVASKEVVVAPWFKCSMIPCARYWCYRRASPKPPGRYERHRQATPWTTAFASTSTIHRSPSRFVVAK